MGSCDGLVCLIVPSNFLIYNPTTQERIEFPGSDFADQNELFGGVRCELFRGFGYDCRSNDYKIVEGVASVSDENWEVAIFLLMPGSWRRIKGQLQEEVQSPVEFSGQRVYWKGVLHQCVPGWSINNKWEAAGASGP